MKEETWKKMDIIFVHGNFPGQFKSLLPTLAQNNRHRIVFLTFNEDSKNQIIPGVEIRTIICHRQPSSTTHHYLHATEEAILKGQAVARELINLKNQGYEPRLVICHGGMGLGVFIKDIMPDTVYVGYFEWFFQNKTSKYLFNEYSLDLQLKANTRNMPILSEINQCDAGIVPTLWQKMQFPKEFNRKLNVIFDGIDGEFFRPCTTEQRNHLQTIEIRNRDSNEIFKIDKHARVLSYATRGMEPLRGFPEFMQMLPNLLIEYKDLVVIIAGLDRRAYSYDAPTHEGSWKRHMLNKLGNFEGKNRIIFTGLLNYDDYRNLLWRTNLHCYFTRPYVTSWSLFEAAACGATMLVNKCEATKNIVKEDSIYWANLDDRQELLTMARKILSEQNPKKGQLLERYFLKNSLKAWEKLLNKEVQRKFKDLAKYT